MSDEALSRGYNLKLTSSNIEMASRVHGDRKTGWTVRISVAEGAKEGRTPELKRHIFRYLHESKLCKSLAICYCCIRDTSCQPRNQSELRKSRNERKKSITSVNHIILHHFVARLCGFGFVNMWWLHPMVIWNETKLDDGIC